MSETIFARPAIAGACIIDPETKEPLPSDGKELPRTAHWLGLLARLDIEECPRPTKDATPKPKAASQPPVSNPEEV